MSLYLMCLLAGAAFAMLVWDIVSFIDNYQNRFNGKSRRKKMYIDFFLMTLMAGSLISILIRIFMGY